MFNDVLHVYNRKGVCVCVCGKEDRQERDKEGKVRHTVKENKKE